MTDDSLRRLQAGSIPGATSCSAGMAKGNGTLERVQDQSELLYHGST